VLIVDELQISLKESNLPDKQMALSVEWVLYLKLVHAGDVITWHGACVTMTVKGLWICTYRKWDTSLRNSVSACDFVFIFIFLFLTAAQDYATKLTLRSRPSRLWKQQDLICLLLPNWPN
jgi:hypothetical protein